MKKTLLTLSALTLLAGTSGFALAQSAPPPAPQAAPSASAPATPGQANPAQPMPNRAHREHSAANHVEGRIAFLKAELKITPQQQPAFDKVAQAMRDNAKESSAARAGFRGRHQEGQSVNAVQRLEMRQRFAAEHAKRDERFLVAFKPFYSSLTPDQQQAADQLMAPRHHGHRKA